MVEETYDGDVYHVANPTVSGRTYLEVYIVNGVKYIEVMFKEPVGFSGNPGRIDRYWSCNINLLYKSSQEAIENHNPKHDGRNITLNDVYF